ncbi:hypothetical protein GTP58_08240 [Duganella sp. CY15W]|uniref:plasmid fertility inhibition factor family protein n=1 Tax=Duganella sp. CY15W TaxID=2692172 RepID=UPI001368FC14|nr:hypothetical protein [Duganella sp. CY15W]MYM28311.1 hypothetical protein [Duganella sp. CY15W]
MFEIPTSEGSVYMCATRSNYNNERRAVVIVDAEKFLALWRREGSSHDDIAHQGTESWPSDRKFKDAVAGFGLGAVNPVPLALVHCYESAERIGVYEQSFFGLHKLKRTEIRIQATLAFTNGITRTIWLLAAGAKAFPVECDLKSAALLQALAGFEGDHYKTFAELIPEHLAA